MKVIEMIISFDHNGYTRRNKEYTIDSLNNSIEFRELSYDYVTANIKY